MLSSPRLMVPSIVSQTSLPPVSLKGMAQLNGVLRLLSDRWVEGRIDRWRDTQFAVGYPEKCQSGSCYNDDRPYYVQDFVPSKNLRILLDLSQNGDGFLIKIQGALIHGNWGLRAGAIKQRQLMVGSGHQVFHERELRHNGFDF